MHTKLIVDKHELSTYLPLSQFKTHSAVYDSDNKWNDLFNGLTFRSS